MSNKGYDNYLGNKTCDNYQFFSFFHIKFVGAFQCWQCMGGRGWELVEQVEDLE